MAVLTFCGAAGTVTGSCSLVKSGDLSFLVDCGLFQGNRTTQELNQKPFPFNPADVDFLVLTHAHIDHSGLLPKLIHGGFKGKIFATEPSADLLEFMLRDSAWIQESNTERENRKRQRRGQELVEALYTMDDAVKTLELFDAQSYEKWFDAGSGVCVRFWNAGHLLGSASAEIEMPDADSGKQLRLLFSGDLGPEEKAFHPEPDAPSGYDYIVCESTYGNRDRDDYTLEKRREILKQELTRGLSRGGNVVIPSFAVERSQELLHDIGTLLATGQIPDAEVYLDSPLASKATEIFKKYACTFEDVELSAEELFRHPSFHITESVDESRAINGVKKGAIIISASGMCNAGRIKHHLKANIWRPESTILFVGYQSPGTLGHIITSGTKKVRIHSAEFAVKAEIRRIGNYSAHADQVELIDWVVERGPVTGGLFLNHGEDDSRAVMKGLLVKKGIAENLIHLPQFDESFDLEPGVAKSHGRSEPRIEDPQLQRDWHNDYAAFILDLSEQLRSTEHEGDRSALIAKLRKTLDK